MNTLLKPHGLTLGQFSILITSPNKAQGGHRVSDIAAAVEVGQPAVTKAMQKFEAMGLVSESDPSDKRTTCGGNTRRRPAFESDLPTY